MAGTATILPAVLDDDSQVIDLGRTDLADGVLLCTFHHHRAHDHRYRSDRTPEGGVRFTRRT
ncbi:MAG TPA: hypothetical protein VFT70_09095 [Nocardioides sp.]|nr:hypothetical protein [Nocardioides sp.]